MAKADRGLRVATIVVTSTKIAMAMQARAILAEVGTAVAVVSMPCWAVLEWQDSAYRRAVLGTAPRIGMKAAMRLSRNRRIGHDGAFIVMSDLRASGAEDDLWRHFGITAKAIAATVREQCPQ
ncbi:hypothetical protein E2C06_00330 [Dankookia rubra]|uniref:Transketolase-like C-terminal domain-containing protein n=1 Tax=Dankookia rubra TaxID=1442381 RepID=A0A4R5QP14_9PROT|nr:hypothetical protein [Dankookia rubra]TDH64427.1 hypothetical protein E2C06_00330 [Dankookia rubra]